MKFVLALLAGLAGLAFTPPVLAQSLPFAGHWVQDDGPGPEMAYTRLAIDGERMTWSGPDKATPVCVQAFALKPERPGTVYVDGGGTRFLAGVKGSLPTYLLQLRSSTCGRAGEDTRIRYPLVYDARHIEVIGYVNGKPVSSRRFHRMKMNTPPASRACISFSVRGRCSSIRAAGYRGPG